VMDEQHDDLTTFYAPTLGFARRLLDANRRDEAGRFEPLHEGENAAAYRRAGAVAWAAFPYAAIIVPGAGADRPDIALDPWGKLRLSQSAYISGQEFSDRCLRELGYQPGTLGTRLSRFDLEFTPSVQSLHGDARDPLDP